MYAQAALEIVKNITKLLPYWLSPEERSRRRNSKALNKVNKTTKNVIKKVQKNDEKGLNNQLKKFLKMRKKEKNVGKGA